MTTRREHNVIIVEVVPNGHGHAEGWINKSLRDSGWERPTINWSCIGTQKIGVGSDFARALILAEGLIMAEFNKIPKSAHSRHSRV